MIITIIIITTTAIIIIIIIVARILSMLSCAIHTHAHAQASL